MKRGTHKRCPKCGEMSLRKNSRREHNGKQSWTCRETTGDRRTCYQTVDPDAPLRAHGYGSNAAERAQTFEPALQRKRLLITWAQNATKVHHGFFAALQNYCKRENAQLLVIPGRYKNPTSQWTESQANEERWAPELVPYLVNTRVRLNRNLVLLADIKMQPTASSPLTGFEGITHGESGILGHPKLQLKTVPTPQSRFPKLLTTTGAITVANYTDTKAGKGGEFHHILGACLAELCDDGVFHLRQVNARADGAFIDLDRAYHPDGSVEQTHAKALVFGDAHYRFADPAVVAATFGAGGLVETLKPETLVWHDLLDSYAVTPHHEGRPFVKLAKHRAGFDMISVEVRETVDWLVKLSRGRTSVVVPSNHDDMLSRWVQRADWRDDPANAEFYLETALQMARASRMEATGAATIDPFGYWLDRLKGRNANVRCLRRGESFTVGGIELSLHGHEGPNGARGSVKNLSRIGVRVISGHGHSPAIEEGHHRTGTMTRLKAEYTGAVGSWLNTHCSIDAFNKRHLHTIIDGKWRG